MRTHVATGIVSYVDSISACTLGKKQIWFTFINIFIDLLSSLIYIA